MNPEQRIDHIRARLAQEFQPQQLELIDDSHLHAGHEGAKQGGHFRVHIVAQRFEGLRPLARHQLVYKSLGELMQTDIHALSITALTPGENLAAKPYS
jgi:BolA protein